MDTNSTNPKIPLADLITPLLRGALILIDGVIPENYNDIPEEYRIPIEEFRRKIDKIY